MTTKTKQSFTPGPWVVRKPKTDPANSKYWICEIHGPGFPFGVCVGVAAGRTAEEAEANARLMAASRKLLRALQYYHTMYGECTHDDCGECAFCAVEEAIQAATGEGE